MPKQMKRPKEPKSFIHPRLYWQEAKLPKKTPKRRDAGGKRLRIVYPDRKAEFAFFRFLHIDYGYDGSMGWSAPCWGNDHELKGYKALKKMRAYDRSCGFGKAVFLGEIK